MKYTNFLRFLLISMLLAAVSLGQSGGNFAIQKSVISGGGGQSAGGSFSVVGTAGQSIAGSTSQGGQFSVASGFWGAGGTRHSLFDFDGDGKADIVVRRPSDNIW